MEFGTKVKLTQDYSYINFPLGTELYYINRDLNSVLWKVFEASDGKQISLEPHEYEILTAEPMHIHEYNEIKPKITTAENIAYVDIDQTLITKVDNKTGSLALDYYGTPWVVFPKKANIDFMKSLKARGYYIIVHSANGWQHAQKVIEVLDLNQFVDEIKTKPQKYIDDESVENWFGPRIFFEE